MSGLEYFDVSKASFRQTAGGLLSLELDGQFYPKVDLHLSFPFSWPQKFISVRDMDGNEIGLIQDLKDLDRNSQEAVQKELNWRYYTPKLTRIRSYKEEFGHAYWEVDSNQGEYKFVTRGRESVRSITATRILIVDVSGNRFEIPDLTKLDTRSRAYLETLL